MYTHIYTCQVLDWTVDLIWPLGRIWSSTFLDWLLLYPTSACESVNLRKKNRSQLPFELQSTKTTNVVSKIAFNLGHSNIIRATWSCLPLTQTGQPVSKLKDIPAYSARVPTRTGKPGKMGRHFPVREKSGNFEQTGKVRENHTKYWKTRGIWDKYYLIFLYIIFSDI